MSLRFWIIGSSRPAQVTEKDPVSNSKETSKQMEHVRFQLCWHRWYGFPQAIGLETQCETQKGYLALVEIWAIGHPEVTVPSMGDSEL